MYEVINMAFDKGFIFGTASAAYQVEGAYNEDGKGLSIWDVFSREKSACKPVANVEHGETGDVACDHYHRYKEDVAILKKLGIKNYRFSISWTRIFPDGTGKINPAGLKFYSDLVDELLANGIEPYVTLFHWDYPYELYKKGGWLNNDSPEWFLEYTKVVVDALSDRVKNWFTINEPQCFIGLGFWTGAHAPFLKTSERDLIIMTRNVMLAHGLAVKYIRENAKTTPKIGFAPIGPVFVPENDTPEAVEAAKKRTFGLTKLNMFSVSWWSVILLYLEDSLKKPMNFSAIRWIFSQKKISKQSHSRLIFMHLTYTIMILISLLNIWVMNRGLTLEAREQLLAGL